MENEKKLTEENVLIIGTKNPEIRKSLNDFAEYHNQTLVILDDKVVEDYLKREESAVKGGEERLKDFLESADNRNAAEERALTLWNLLTQNADLSYSQQRIFTKSEVVNKTTLSHRQLGDALELFSLFGLVEFTKGQYEFKFVFGKETQAAAILADLSESVNQVIINRERYIAALKNCGKDDIEIDSELEKVGGDIKKMLSI